MPEAVRGPGRPRPRPARPVRRLRRLGRRRPTDHLAAEFGLGLGARAPVVAAPRALLDHPFQPLLGQAPSPAADLIRVRSQLLGHGLVRLAFRGHEPHLRPFSQPDRCAARARPPLQARSVRLRPLDVDHYSQGSSFPLSVRGGEDRPFGGHNKYFVYYTKSKNQKDPTLVTPPHNNCYVQDTTLGTGRRGRSRAGGDPAQCEGLTGDKRPREAADQRYGVACVAAGPPGGDSADDQDGAAGPTGWTAPMTRRRSRRTARAGGLGPILDPHPRRPRQAERSREHKAPRAARLGQPPREHYQERSTVERAVGRLQDELGGRPGRRRGPTEVYSMCARLTGAGYRVRVPSGEGVAAPSRREPCVRSREGSGEA